MHGLIFTALKRFLTSAYGAAVWRDVGREAGVDIETFEAMSPQDPARFEALLAAAAARLDKSRDAVLEDLGTFLVFDPADEAVRRLLRFGGSDFTGFLHSLEDLPGRARLALDDLALPALDLAETGPGEFALTVAGPPEGLGHLVMGVLRAMADDYGDLALFEIERGGGVERIAVRLAARRFTPGRAFSLAQGGA